MAAGSVWKGLVGLGLFALAHAAFSAAQRKSPPGGRSGAPASPHGRRRVPGAGAGSGQHHHRPEARARRRGRPCPWGRAAGRAELPGERGARPSAAGKGGKNGGWEGGAAARRVAASAWPLPCRCPPSAPPAPSRLPAGGIGRAPERRHRGRPGCRGGSGCRVALQPFPWGFLLPGCLFACTECLMRACVSVL